MKTNLPPGVVKKRICKKEKPFDFFEKFGPLLAFVCIVLFFWLCIRNSGSPMPKMTPEEYNRYADERDREAVGEANMPWQSRP